MKPSDFKNLIKEATREVIREELKDIILEAIKHTPISSPIKEITSFPEDKKQSIRENYKNLIGNFDSYGNLDQNLNFNSNDVSIPFQPIGFIDTANGKLPDGEVSLAQITNLMGKK